MTQDEKNNTDLSPEQEAQVVEVEQEQATSVEDEDDAFDPAMFAQVQEMMEKLQRAEELERELGDLKGRYARLLADFENYRRRTNQDVLDAQGVGVAKAAEEMMPIYDDLTRALEFGKNDPSKIVSGLESVSALILRTFEKLGLSPTGKEGEAFDPAFHEALSVVPGEQDGVILQVYQVGFRMGDRLVRPARVVVSQGSN
ncbi:nucleotide exchange factor GrpE [Deinococcus yavapaiensis]|uniref:Protein GrpE n=1 Tax=Deinococcus yavapaiensis KR-236 TaxID=694435 RepID=A0A318SA20_9DEIO|nr:nucleotide exchange factor GrpE [Deinococcus yavapaiensis]PYE56199.1 molecular chaperone GrpE [Deinococcus yavapaiensis KR-236]